MLSSRDFLKYSEIIYRMWFNTNSIVVSQDSLFTAERRNPAVILPFMYDGKETFAIVYSDESEKMSFILNAMSDGDKSEIVITVVMDNCFEVDMFYSGVVVARDTGKIIPLATKIPRNVHVIDKHVIHDRKDKVTADLYYVDPDFTSDDLSNMMTVIALSMGTEIVTRRGTC